jgi:hypothetical protein
MFIFIADHSRGDGTSVGHWRPSYKVVLAASFEVEKVPGDYEDQKINGHLEHCHFLASLLLLSRFRRSAFLPGSLAQNYGDGLSGYRHWHCANECDSACLVSMK